MGHDILQKLMADDGIELGPRYMDCGVLIYDLNTQDVHCGGSGCGCCASVLCGHILKAMEAGTWSRVLVAATGALMSPLSCQQGGKYTRHLPRHSYREGAVIMEDLQCL